MPEILIFLQIIENNPESKFSNAEKYPKSKFWDIFSFVVAIVFLETCSLFLCKSPNSLHILNENL